MQYVLISVAGISLLFVGYLLGRTHYQKQLAFTQERAEDILTKARKEAESLKREKILEGTKEIQKRQEKLDTQMEERKRELKQMEERILKREDRLEKKSNKLEEMEKVVVKNAQTTRELVNKGQLLIKEERNKLENIAGLSSSEARERLLDKVEKESRRFFSQKIKEVKEKASEEAEKEARKIIACAIGRYGADQVEETTVSSVPLPNDDYKGRIIGREGRNIRTFEALTGVEVLVDDTPEAVVLSCFHPIRREIARMAMKRLVEDGRIHPAHIKKQVEKAKKRMEERVKEEGQKAVFDLGLDGIHPQLVNLIGKLSYRTSYGQNQLQHSMEVSFIARMLAEELGTEPIMAKRAGILHDIGKAVDHKVEGPHPLIGADLAKRYGESEEIIHAIAAHNEDVEPQSVLAVLIQAADALSAARPGARQDALESYIQRLENLERIGNSFPGVKEAFCIQAGREIRIMVNPEEVSDQSAARLSYEIARTIEQKMDYPGEIKVNVIRKTQFLENAR